MLLFSFFFGLFVCLFVCLFVYLFVCLSVNTKKKRSVCSLSWPCLLYNTGSYLHPLTINDLNDGVGGDGDDDDDDSVDYGCVDGNDVFPIMHNRHLLQHLPCTV